MASIDRERFKFLYDSVMEKVQEDFAKRNKGKIPKDQQIFGREGHDPKKGTLRTFMYQVPDIKQLMIETYKKPSSGTEDFSDYINPRYLYQKLSSNYNKGDAQITIENLYDKIIPWYLGYEDLDQFFRENAKEIKWIDYRGYYYSFRDHIIKDYTIAIKFSKRGLSKDITHGDYEVKEKGFHDDGDNIEYKGYAYNLGGKLHFVLDKKESNSDIIIDKLKMVFDAGGNPENENVMKGAILAVSAQKGNPIISTETILIKDSYKKESQQQLEEELLNVERYLHLHRCNFWIRPRPMILENVLIKRNTSVDQISHLVGAYRVWRFDEKFNIVQAKITINSNYEAHCFNNMYKQGLFKEQVCLVQINNIDKLDSKTIFISSHPKEGTGLISQIILNYMPEWDWNKLDDDTKILKGTISFIGRGNSIPNIRAIALKWEGKTETDIPLKTISYSEAKADKKRAHLFNSLLNLTRKNLPPSDIVKEILLPE